MRRLTLLAALTTVLAAILAAPLSAGGTFPEVIPLPDGFQPEGIANRGTTFYAGWLGRGAIYRGDLRTGSGAVLVQPQSGRAATGMKVDGRDRLFVSGAFTGQAYVYDAQTGADAHTPYQLNAPEASFINDVVLTRNGAYFTDSFQPFLYRVPISRGGQLGAQSDVERIPLSGDIAFVPDQFNTNGIEAARGGDTLVIVQTVTGKLFTVDPHSGVTNEIELTNRVTPGVNNVQTGDGLLLDGKTLFVVEGFHNRIAVVQLGPQLARGEIVAYLTDTDFDIPTTVADLGRRLYAPNARFTTPATPATKYWITQVQKPAGGEDDDEGENDD
jgi:hypothetical protein